MKSYLAVTAILATFFIGSLTYSQPSRAADGKFEASLTACPSDKTIIGTVNACGKIWALTSGTASLKADGSLHLEVHGLVLNDTSVGKYNGSPDGVDAVAAAVVCSGAVVAQADPVPLSQTGDANVDTRLTLPAHCFAPTILVRERYEGKIGGWLAVAGF